MKLIRLCAIISGCVLLDMNKINLLWILGIVLSCVAVSAIPVLEVEVTLNSNGTGSIDSVRFSEGDPFSSNGTYGQRLRMVDKNQILYEAGFPSTYILLADPPFITESYQDYFVIPYKGNVGDLQLLVDDSVVDEYSLRLLCRPNNICVEPETEFTCPLDCGLKPVVSVDSFDDAAVNDRINFGLNLIYLAAFILLFAFVLYEASKVKTKRR